MSKTKNDIAWESLFIKYHVLDEILLNGQYTVTADQMREFREPRLMAKFDRRVNLPRIFAQNALAILPISKKEFVISHFDAYMEFDKAHAAITRAYLPAGIQSLNPMDIPNETTAVNCALAAGILSDFLDEESLTASVAGRMGADDFSFSILNIKTGGQIRITARAPQIEIDAAFEGAHSIALIEAKRDMADDFLVRQLYYPYRKWEARMLKQIRPVFLIYSNSVFYLYEYLFEEPGVYNSQRLIRYKRYSIEDTLIRESDIERIWNSASPKPEPSEPSFPQANNFERVINLCELLFHQDLDAGRITDEYAFDLRQTKYYTDAGRYLGLIELRYEKRKPIYLLTPAGRNLMRLNYRQRQLSLCALLFERRVFYEAYRLYKHTGAMPSSEAIVRIMKKCSLPKIKSDATFYRRAQTVSGWLSWVRLLCQGRIGDIA